MRRKYFTVNWWCITYILLNWNKIEIIYELTTFYYSYSYLTLKEVLHQRQNELWTVNHCSYRKSTSIIIQTVQLDKIHEIQEQVTTQTVHLITTNTSTFKYWFILIGIIIISACVWYCSSIIKKKNQLRNLQNLTDTTTRIFINPWENDIILKRSRFIHKHPRHWRINYLSSTQNLVFRILATHHFIEFHNFTF